MRIQPARFGIRFVACADSPTRTCRLHAMRDGAKRQVRSEHELLERSRLGHGKDELPGILDVERGMKHRLLRRGWRSLVLRAGQ